MGERWFPGTWLGSRASSGEHLVARNSDGVVVRTRAVKEPPEKITIKALDNVLGKPWAPVGVMTEKNVIPRADSGAVLKEFNEPLTFVPRSMFLTKAILKRFGHTASCSKCRALTRGDSGSTAPHSKECRQRLEQEVARDPVLKRKLDDAEERKTKYIADEIEHAVNKACKVSERSVVDTSGVGAGSSGGAASST